ncbi:MAG: hypothetical protein JW984_16015 [Deltaproteobacteria bacterium]|uniref:DUF4412 domain-containing protein n=1 Tax=Candidatus Zymogenus saltonus TaxID=2844893 RepID=A0A9D8KHE3_9DELT|nr:hypothetical protein [Candidatus Zymogenus saltonus]
MRNAVRTGIRIVLKALFPLLAMSTSTAVAWDTSNIFPINEGARWKYTGMWENINTGKKTPISLEAKVLRFVNGGGYLGAHMQGHPTDIESIKSGEVAKSTYVYYVLGNRVYKITNPSDMNSAMSGRYDPREDEIFMTFPLKPGAYFGKMAGDNGWQVEAASIPIPAVRCKMDGYIIILKKKDMIKLMTFVPIVGITSYQYLNYNTGDKIKLNLSEYVTGE